MILGKVISFLTRNDGACKHRARRRLGSSRASVFLEYAIILPLAILTISTMIEFAAFWDAKIMANHTAWTCARIASVEAGQQTKYVDSPAVNRLRTKGMKTATVLLMSTCAMGSMHGSSSEYTKHWFDELIMKPLKQLRQAMVEGLKSKLTDFLKEAIGRFVGDDVVSSLVKEVVGWIVESLFDPLVKLLVDVINRLFDPIFAFLGGILDGQRQLRQLAYAAGRVAEFPDIITVTERTDTPFVFSKQPTVLSTGDWRLDFPRVLDSDASSDKWFVKSDAPWPPNRQSQRMIDVKIRWPFERAWMFPVLSQAKLSAEDAKKLDGVPTAVGRAMAYPQPIICNDNLKSEGATPYDPGNTNAVPDIVTRIKNKYIGFLKVAALYYHYQLTDEEVGPFDSSDSTRSYKGVGLGVSGGPEKDKYWKTDGLVFWMDRAPDKPSDQGAWKKKTRPADYYRCWCEIVEDSNECCKFWYGKPFGWWIFKTETTKQLDRLCNHKYRDKEWFFWGDGDNRHLRVKHGDPKDVYYLTIGLALNNVYFVLPDELKNGAVRNVSESDFNSHVPESEKGVVAYGTYQDVRKNDDGRLAVRARTMTEAWCDPTVSARVLKEEPAAFESVKSNAAVRHKETKELIKACSLEIDNAVGGGTGGDPSDPGKLIDFDMSDDEIMKNPEKAAELLEKKLNELKPKVYAAIRRIDKAEESLRNFDKGRTDKLNAWKAKRDGTLIDFAVAMTRAAVAAGSTSPGEVVKELQSLHWQGRPITEVTDEIVKYFYDYKAAVIEWYNAEVELGQLLNCKAAKEKRPVRPDDPDPVDPPDPGPDRPPIPSPDSGSDNDYGGDSWSLHEDGWRKDGGGSDI